jgi:hypothetical protein
LVGSTPEVDTHVDEGLERRSTRRTPCATSPANTLVERDRLARRSCMMRRSSQKNQDHDRAGRAEAELLADHREQEVGVRLGQVVQLLDAAAQALRRRFRRDRWRSASA